MEKKLKSRFGHLNIAGEANSKILFRIFDYRYDKSLLMSKLASSSLSTGAMGVILILLVRIVNNIPVCVWCWRQSNRCTKCENDLLAQIYTLTPICSLHHPFPSVTFYHSL